MIWKEKGINKYPDIILSDCLITNIQKNQNELIINFSEYGFIKKDSQQNKYFRTDAAQIIMEHCDITNISIKEIRTHQLSEELYFDSRYDIESKIFLQNVNTEKWQFEIVEEYYSTGGGIYIGQIRENEISFWCHVKVQFKNLVYLWNDIRYDCPI